MPEKTNLCGCGRLGSDDRDRRLSEEAIRKREEGLDKTLADSFPSSDPPSSIPDPEDENSAEDNAA